MMKRRQQATARVPKLNPVSLLGAGGKRAPVAAAQRRIQALFSRGYALDRTGRWQKVNYIGQGSRLYGHDLSPNDVEPVPPAVASALNAYVAGKGGIDAVPNNRLLNPKKLTREEFERRYWGKDAHTVPAMTRREFYSDYRESGMAFDKYKKSTSTPYPNPRPHTYHVPASNFRVGDIGTLESDAGVGFDAAEGQFRTRRRALVKGKVRSAPAAHLPPGRYVVETPAYGRGHATVKRIKNPPTDTDIRALRDALVANGVEARLTKTGITASLAHGGKRTARITPSAYTGASFNILFSNGERGTLTTDGKWSPKQAARGVFDALMTSSIKDAERLHGEHVRTQNPKARTKAQESVLLREALHRLDAKGSDKAWAPRMRLAALNTELGRGMAETTEAWRRARGETPSVERGYQVWKRARKNPALRISDKRPATMSAKAINAELDKLEAESTRFMHEAIAAGRGHERPSDRVHMTDPLSMAVKAVENRMWELRREVEHRYGRWTPRLPESRMFGAREKA